MPPRTNETLWPAQAACPVSRTVISYAFSVQIGEVHPETPSNQTTSDNSEELKQVTLHLRHANQKVEVPICRGQVAILEEHEVDLPEACIADPERVRLGPVTTVRQKDAKNGPSRAVDFDKLIGSRSDVVDNPSADEVDSDRVIQALGLVVRDAKDNAARFVDGKIGGIVAQASASAEDVKLSESFPRTRCKDDVRKGACRHNQACGESDRQALVECTIMRPVRDCEVCSEGETCRRGESH